MPYALLQPFGSTIWVRGDGTTTSIAASLNNPPFNIPSNHTVVSLSVIDPLGIYTITNNVSNTVGVPVTFGFSPAVSASAIVQFNYSGYYI
jgi:hypothetical protein